MGLFRVQHVPFLKFEWERMVNREVGTLCPLTRDVFAALPPLGSTCHILSRCQAESVCWLPPPLLALICLLPPPPSEVPLRHLRVERLSLLHTFLFCLPYLTTSELCEVKQCACPLLAILPTYEGGDWPSMCYTRRCTY